MSSGAGELGRQVRMLFLVAMALFVVTIVIGILNGADAVEFDRNQLLTHVHSGTLGWLSLAIVAATLWITGMPDRRLAIAFAILIPVYVLAFYSGSLPARAITGTVLLAAMIWLFIWGWQCALRIRSLPSLAVALGLTSFLYGGIIGVLLQVQLATETQIFGADGDVVGAHASTMVFSYLILVAMGLIEWQVKGTTGRPILGLVQVLALFGGGLLVAATLLFAPSQIQAAGGLYLLFELIAVVLFAMRILPAALRIDWMTDSAGRYLATASVFVIAAMAIFMIVVASFVANPDPTALNFGLVVASDHAAFIGVMTNLFVALMFILAADRSDGPAALRQLAFVGMNVGLVVFLAGLITDTSLLKQLGAPTMGVSLLVLLAIASMRLRSSTLSATDG
ncbi:MAG: hypothetical protein AABZ33_08525 [Chloroflexota bacterium]